MYVALEGIDASAKSKQAEILAEKLKAKVFHFPDYNSPSGALIKGHLDDGWRVAREGVSDATLADYTYYPRDDNATVLQALMTVNRHERAQDMIDASAIGPVVIDRYVASSLVYGKVDGVDPEWIEKLNKQLLVQPDICVLLDISVEESLARRPERRDRYERDAQRMCKVRLEYLRLFVEKYEKNDDGAIWLVVDGSGTVEQVADRVWEAVQHARG